MKCEICHKNDATTAYTHIVDDAKKTLLLCASCIPKGEQDSAPTVVSQNEVVQGVPELKKKVKVEFSAAATADPAGSVTCDGCGMTYEQFKKAGRLGCHRCYGVFSQQLERLLKRIHGADAHCGKGPVEVGVVPSPDRALDQLRDKLKEAVSCEDFERAAQIRDQIRSIESGEERETGSTLS